jgi:hypothetical protein
MNQPIIPIMRLSKFHHPCTFVRWAQNAVRRVAQQGHVQTLSLSLSLPARWDAGDGRARLWANGGGLPQAGE